MTIHVVLFRPRPDISDEERDGLLEAMRVAARDIPAVRRFRIGTHIVEPVPYVISGFPSFPWMALLEFDDEMGLRSYLAHPLHRDLGARFNATAEAAMIYDFTVRGEPSNVEIQIENEVKPAHRCMVPGGQAVRMRVCSSRSINSG